MVEFLIISKTGSVLYRSNDKDLISNLFNLKYSSKVGYKLVEVLSECLDPDNKGTYLSKGANPVINNTKVKVKHLYDLTNVNQISKLR